MRLTKQQQAVIQTILKGFPLNIMYWNVCEDGSYEMIDGQQRTLSVCGVDGRMLLDFHPGDGSLHAADLRRVSGCGRPGGKTGHPGSAGLSASGHRRPAGFCRIWGVENGLKIPQNFPHGKSSVFKGFRQFSTFFSSTTTATIFYIPSYPAIGGTNPIYTIRQTGGYPQ